MAREIWFGRLCLVACGAAGGLILVEACSEPMGEMLVDAGTAMMDAGKTGLEAGGSNKDGGGMLSDAGDLLRDAGRLMQDAGMALMDAGSNIRDGGADASAQPSGAMYKSGSRIQFRVTNQNGADGSVMAGYPASFDTQRNEACSPMKTADGKVRCIPTGSGATLGTFYADATCTQPLYVISDAACPTPTYFWVQETTVGACGAASGTWRIYQRGAKHTGNFFQKSGSSCTSQTQTAGSSWYAIGAEIPLTSFVEFTEASPITL